jgi:hypothetical protein
MPSLEYPPPCPAHDATSWVNETLLAIRLAGGLALGASICSDICRATRRVVHLATSHYIRFAICTYASESTLDETRVGCSRYVPLPEFGPLELVPFG